MSPSGRWIVHVDLDAFFASVEELLRPELRGQPLIVGGQPESRGVVASASYAARSFGVRSAMPMGRALRLCPQAVLVPPRHGVYGEHSRRVMTILREYTPALEQISIDEAFLDLTGTERLWGPAEAAARGIQERIADECHLPVSLGVASSRLVAKIACDLGKPHGLVVVPQGGEAEFLAPLPVERLWGVGQVTGRRLRERGIATIGDVAGWSEEALVALLGEAGRRLYEAARGIDPSEVHEGAPRRSISREETFVHDLDDLAHLRATLLWMSESVATTLRREHALAGTVRIKMRTPDFETVLRQTTLGQPTDQGQVIYETAAALLERYWHPPRPLRLIGVGVAGLLDSAGYQLGLLDETPLRNARLNRTLDEIRARYGEEAIGRASQLRQRGRPPGSAPG